MDSEVAMTPLHRHQLAWLTAAGWQRLCDQAWDATARDCLAHWAVHRLPLVVTRQRGANPRSELFIAMGLPAPGRWQRRRLALEVARREVLYFDEFPIAGEVTPLLPQAARADWRRLCTLLGAAGLVARVYGSYGWQQLGGLDHVHRGSDIDVWMAVSDPGQADAAAAMLQAFPCAGPRLDGELAFADGTSVAWREWLAWRGGRARSLLAKTLAGPSLSDGRRASLAESGTEATL
jgi:phosphoribosyl-dephospho-CoA transferase